MIHFFSSNFEEFADQALRLVFQRRRLKFTPSIFLTLGRKIFHNFSKNIKDQFYDFRHKEFAVCNWRWANRVGHPFQPDWNWPSWTDNFIFSTQERASLVEVLTQLFISNKQASTKAVSFLQWLWAFSRDVLNSSFCSLLLSVYPGL